MSKFYMIGFSGSDPIACTSIDDAPATYETRDEVQTDIDDHASACVEAGMEDDLEWRAVPVSEYTLAEIREVCGLD